MALTDMQVFNEFVMPATIETLGQMVARFNEASGGAIRLTTDGFAGDFLQNSFYTAIHDSVRRVDRYLANATVPGTQLAQKKDSAVKVAGGVGPIWFEPGQMTWLEKPTAEAIEAVSRNFAEAMLRDQLNTVIASLAAAMRNRTDSTNDMSATSGLTYVALNAGHAKFGDMSSNLVSDVMDGTAYHRLIQANLSAPLAPLFSQRGITIVNLLNKNIIVTDAPALYAAGTPNKRRVLSLSQGAATVYDGGDVITNVSSTNGLARIQTSIQVDYTFGVSIKGYTWDEALGGKSPTDAELATGANWPRTSNHVKNTAGVITEVDAAL
jgi:hypothetical protein